MKRYVNIFAALALAIAVGSLVISFAQAGKTDGKRFQRDGMRGAGAPPPPGFDRGGFHPRMMEELGLSDAQKEQVRTLHDQARTSSEQYHEQMRSVHEELKALVQAATFNEEQARQLLADKAKVSAEMELIRLRTDSAIYNLLTAEQKERLAQFEKERPHRGRDGRPDGARPMEN